MPRRAVRTFDGATRLGAVAAAWPQMRAEVHCVRFVEPGHSVLQVGADVLLATVDGGARDVLVAAEGAPLWRGPKLAGSVGFVPRERRVVSTWPARSLTYCCLFGEPEARVRWREDGRVAPEPRSRPAADDPFLSAGMLRLAAALRSDDALDAVLAESLATALLAHAAGLDRALPVAVHERDAVGRALELIHAAFPAPVPLASLVEISGLPRLRFLAAFRAQTGSAPHQYLVRQRLDRARALLRGTRRTIDDVARELGFANAAHLRATFQRHLGVSPAAWRKGDRM